VEQGCFLVVDDEPLAIMAIARVLGRFGTVTSATTKGEALGILRAHPVWSGVIVDLRLPDGSGLDVLSYARERSPLSKAVLLSGAMSPEAINGAFALNALCLCKPWPADAFRQFAQEALVTEAEAPRRITDAVNEIAAKHDLTPAQTEILLSSVQGLDRPTVVADRCVSANTHKTLVRRMLRKTSTRSLGELRDYVLRSSVLNE
jgi:DNA-binding NarL/FixJ family response regulator